jgi:hypothetical protein
MARGRRQSADQLSLLEARVSTAPLVPGIREKVNGWRDGGYKGISDTTRILLNYWFLTDHRLPNGRKFAYHPFQREAVETLIYLYKGIAQGIAEQRSDIAGTRYQAYLAAGVERWKEYREQLAPLGKKPVLFVMMNDTAEADDVGDWLRKKYPSEFGAERLLIIHTDRSGDVSRRDLDLARKAAREIDDERSPIDCVVSVMMLREGWDVQSVAVIVGLRPYSSKANILPEQTVGRGLRLMFRGNPDYVERVDVIGNPAFIGFVEQLEREEDIQLETFRIGEKVSIITIAPDPNKMDKDIAIPVLSPILTRKKSLAEEIAALEVDAFDCPLLPRKQDDAAAKTFRYEVTTSSHCKSWSNEITRSRSRKRPRRSSAITRGALRRTSSCRRSLRHWRQRSENSSKRRRLGGR